MKLKINKACDIGSISVLPPRRTGGSGSGGMSASASAAAGVVSSQQRSQTLSQQSFSQGGVSGGASLLHSQSQLSQASLDENLLSLQLPSPARDQRFSLYDDSSKRVSSLPASSASCVREESQLQLAKVSSNPMHRWNSSIPDTRYQVANEDVERKFQHLASSVHKMGMVLDSVQSDVMHLNRAMKEASLDSGSIRQKVILLESSLQQILKGQDDLKALLESNTKVNPDHTSVLNSHTSKLNEIFLAFSTWQTQVQADIRQLQGDIFRTFTKEMEGIVRAIRALSSRPAVMQMMDQSYDANERLPRNQIPVANGKSPVNQTSVANGRSQMNQIPVPNRRSLVSQIPVANGSPAMNQVTVANGTQMNQTPVADERAPMKQVPVADGRSRMNQIPIAKVLPAPLVYPAKVTDLKPKVERGQVKAAPQKLFASIYRVAPKQEEVANRKFNPHVLAKKAPVCITIESDDESEERASCVILKTETAWHACEHIMVQVARSGS
ncbi:hypothetical protein GUJ93_ZPchr0006g44669 [Zizania palustris]|uniref:Protein PAIR1 n=1 Tax=Zizania palustris TaxID=103762 RepID=A0A8J5SCF9_ZIZPA|nr:hypothetical protein GUJ93_ZPchr0006g44669 [Zizania palustris]